VFTSESIEIKKKKKKRQRDSRGRWVGTGEVARIRLDANNVRGKRGRGTGERTGRSKKYVS